MSDTEPRLDRLRAAVVGFTALADERADEAVFLAHGRSILVDLLVHDDWLPQPFCRPSTVRYQQYLLHCDPRERFSIVSFVWAPSQHTPIHDHRVWGMVGVLRGQERNVSYRRNTDGRLDVVEDAIGGPGAITLLSPAAGDIHQVSNAAPDQVTISIHVYGGNIGTVKRAVFDPLTGEASAFVSAFGNNMIPNIWR